MPFYYAINPGGQTTNVTGNTITRVLRMLTVANQRAAIVTGISLCPSFATIAAMVLRFTQPVVSAGTGGAAFTPAPRHPSNPAASTTVFTAPTASPGGGLILGIGANQSGVMGQWMSQHLDQGFWFNPNGFGSGINSSATSSSVLFDMTAEFLEGP